MERIFIFARVARNARRARWRVDPVTHSVAEADSVGEDKGARGSSAFVDDLHRTFAGCRAAGVEVVSAEVNPSRAHLAVIDLDLCGSAGVIDSVSLQNPVGVAADPRVNRIKTCLRYVWRVRCNSRLGAGGRAGIAIRNGISRARAVVFVVITSAGAVE